MNNKIEILITLLLLIIIIVIKIIVNKKNKNTYRDELSKKIKKINIVLVLISIILFVIAFIVNKYVEGEKVLLMNIINALSIGIIPLPLATFNLYKTMIKENDKLTYTTNVVTDIVDEKYTKLFNKAGIHLVFLSKTKPKFIKESIPESSYTKKMLNKNIHLKSTSDNILSKLKGENIIQEFNSLENLYNDIMKYRVIHDNYLKALKYNIFTFIPLVIIYTVFKLNSFPFTYSLLLIMIAKLIATITTEVIYRKLPADSDIGERQPYIKKTLFGFQEIVITIIETFIIAFFFSIPYMNIAAQGGSMALCNTILYITVIYTNILVTLSLYNEQLLIKNILKIFKNIPAIIYLIILIAISITINYFVYFTTRNIGLQNYFASILMAIICIVFLELVKFARFTTIKGVKKYGNKNNKKHKRS